MKIKNMVMLLLLLVLLLLLLLLLDEDVDDTTSVAGYHSFLAPFILYFHLLCMILTDFGVQSLATIV
jgi:hypothetical protein